MTRLPGEGLVTPSDSEAIAWCLDEVAQRFGTPTIIEIGVREGQTGKGMAAHMGARPFSYYGIDNNRDMPVAPPFPGAHMVISESTEALDRLPAEFHFVFVDGCHCQNHVVLDFILYGQRVVPGGFLAMHDSAPSMQGKDYQGHGPQTPEFHVATVSALDMIKPILSNWELVRETPDEGQMGTLVYKKL